MGSVTGRLGARFGGFLGVEGEYSYGVDSDHSNGFKTSAENQYAGYGVAYLPLRRDFDLFARVGYGSQDLRVADEAADLLRLKGSAAGVNYGAGAQWFFLRHDGVRFDYTRYDPSNRGVATADNVWRLLRPPVLSRKAAQGELARSPWAPRSKPFAPGGHADAAPDRRG